MSNSSPTISVIMSVYNGELYLAEAIESILHQTFTDFEFIIIDDGSTDKTKEIISSFSDRRIKVIENKKNIGLSTSLNKGASIARGKYLARMDADDISLPERLAIQTEFLEAHPEIGLVGCNANVIDEHGTVFRTFYMPQTNALIRWNMCFRTPFIHPTVVIRKEFLEHVRGYDDSILYSQDRDLWQRLSSFTSFANLPDILFHYRNYATNVSHKYSKIQVNNSAISNHRMMIQMLNHDVPLDVCQNLRRNKFESSDKVVQAMRLIRLLYNRFMSEKSLSRNEIDTISMDTAKRLLNLVIKSQTGIRREYFALLFPLYPLLALTMTRVLLSKVLKWISRN